MAGMIENLDSDKRLGAFYPGRERCSILPICELLLIDIQDRGLRVAGGRDGGLVNLLHFIIRGS